MKEKKNMEDKQKILDLLKRDVITMDEALEMLDKLNVPSNAAVTPVDDTQTAKKVTLHDRIKEITDEVLSDFDINAVLKIMQDMNWEYLCSGHVVTKDEVISCIKDNINTALKTLIKNYIDEDWPSAYTSCGGFQVRAWVDDDDWPNIQIELAFQPYSGFGYGDLDELVKLSKNQ